MKKTAKQKLESIVEGIIKRKLTENDNDTFGDFKMGKNAEESFQNLYDNFLEFTATTGYAQGSITDEQYERLVTEGQKRLENFLIIIKALENG